MIAFLYYLVSDGIRIVLFPLIIAICFLSLGNLNDTNSFIKSKWFIYFFLLFIGVALVQLTSGTFTPFIIYLLAAPVMAHFFLHNEFYTKGIKLSFYAIVAYMVLHFLLTGSLIDVFSQMSANYVSVVLIMNAAVLAIVQYRQGERVHILPGVFTLILSILALGRSGIGCSLIFLTAILYLNWSTLAKFKKYLILFSFIVPFMGYIFIQGDSLLYSLENISFFKKFSERGLDSPARDILMREYLSYLERDEFLIYIGYNYSDNPWFKHYGLNPHNSYIRLHHYFGIFFFLIVAGLLFSLLKLLFTNRFYAFILLAILVRAYTDTVIFLSLYDFLMIALVFLAFKKGKFRTPSYQVNPAYG